MTDRAIYRVVQEALTNAAKHAPGAAVTVTLRREGPEAVVNVVNEAPGRVPGRADGAGWGLVGLDERVRQAGGTLHARPVDGGFAVTARLPLTPGATATPPERDSVPHRELARARRRGAAQRDRGDLGAGGRGRPCSCCSTFVHDRLTFGPTVLDQETYQQLRIGEPQPSVEQRLPADEVGGGERPRHAPADPPGADECRFYHVVPNTLSPAYRLCFTDGRLSHKDEVDLDT